jgi:hypothetical protein
VLGAREGKTAGEATRSRFDGGRAGHSSRLSKSTTLQGQEQDSSEAPTGTADYRISLQRGDAAKAAWISPTCE